MANESLSSFQADDGERIDLAVQGQGRPLVILHGWTGSHREWLPYGKALAGHYTVYSWDARGHGGRFLTAGPPTLERMARDLRGLIEHYGLQRPLLLGHSMGALTVWEYVRQFGCGGLGGLCLLDQSPRLITDEDWSLGIYGRFSAQDNQRFIARLKEDFAEAMLELAANGHNARFTQSYRSNALECQMAREYLRSLDPAPLIACWENLAQADYRAVLPMINVPTLLIYGSDSQFYSSEVAAYVRDHTPGAVLHIYPDADHFPHLWQRERFIDEVRTFFAT